MNIKSVKAAEAPSLPSPMQAVATADSVTNPVTSPLPALDGQEVLPNPPPAAMQDTTNATTTQGSVRHAAFGTPVVVSHETAWYRNDVATRQPLNGPIAPKQWRLLNPVGDAITDGSDLQKSIARLEYFLLMFPPAQLELMVRETNLSLSGHSKKLLTKGELLKFFGVVLLASRFEYTTRASLWTSTPRARYMTAPAFGKTGMPRNRFDDIMRCLCFSSRPSTRPDGMSSETYRWKLIDDFVDNYNKHRASTFVPSHLVCVDESMSRWYGLGGNWINMGLPNYVAIDRKPENGCEIQDAACGISGVMLQLKLVKSVGIEDGGEIDDGLQEDEDSGLLHGTVVLKELVRPYFYTDRIVCADSYFASVGCAQEMRRCGLRFIGVVKTATKKYPMQYLTGIELHNRGDRHGLLALDESGMPTLLAYVWMDRDRRYFITNTSSLEAGAPYERVRWRQISDEANAEPERVELTVPQPVACEIYYSTCGKVDHHNRHRQDTLKLEKKIETKSWDKRVGISLLAMTLVDTWLVYSGATRTKETQSEFYEDLATELIDNTYDTVGGGRRRTSQGNSTGSPVSLTDNCGRVRCGVDHHVTPTKRKKKKRNGDVTNHSMQGHCVICKKKTRFLCSTCNDEREKGVVGKSPWICHAETGRDCFKSHTELVH